MDRAGAHLLFAYVSARGTAHREHERKKERERERRKEGRGKKSRGQRRRKRSGGREKFVTAKRNGGL